jgi:Fic family protein
MDLKQTLLSEKNVGHKGGIYNKLQVDMAFNSNHIEGSRLTHDQTRYIYETNTIGVGVSGSEEAVNVNDVIETVNHFRCFDFILDTLGKPLTEQYIKQLHMLLKSGVVDKNAVIGEFKTCANEVGAMETAAPEKVPELLGELLSQTDENNMTLYDIAAFHSAFEMIHPFYDGNGRVGRLIILKQCLENDIVPIIIEDRDKMFYYMGLKQMQTGNDSERLINVFLSSQDDTEQALKYFGITYSRPQRTYSDVISHK